MGEHLGLLYRDLYNVSTVSLRYAAVISAWLGPGTSVPGRGVVIVGSTCGTWQDFGDRRPYVVWRGGEEFIDARDCALANVAALVAPDPAQGVYTIGLGQLCSFDDFVDAVRQLYPALQVDVRTPPTGGFAGFPHVRTAASDISAAAREAGLAATLHAGRVGGALHPFLRSYASLKF